MVSRVGFSGVRPVVIALEAANDAFDGRIRQGLVGLTAVFLRGL